jgi:hypothetical protein
MRLAPSAETMRELGKLSSMTVMKMRIITYAPTVSTPSGLLMIRRLGNEYRRLG